MTTIPNPFGDWQVGRLDPGQGIPVSMLVQAAITGSVDDGIPDHLDDMCATLTDRGPQAWREAALLATQYMASSLATQDPQTSGAAYKNAQPPQVWASPSLTATHTTVAGWLDGGEDQARAELAKADDQAAEGAARMVIVMLVIGSGYPQEKAEALRAEILGPVLAKEQP